MAQRISGQSIDVYIGTELVHLEKIGLDITDNTAAASTRGVPDGWVAGDVSASGDIEISTKEFKKIISLASSAGSYRSIPEQDLMFYGEAGDEELKIEAFGCKFLITTPLDNDPKGGSILTHKFKYLVTSPDLVKINGIPYLESELVNKVA